MRQPMLPLWKRAVFVDWHGLLSREPFWMSIVGNRRHPLRSRLEVKLAEVFAVGLALMQL